MFFICNLGLLVPAAESLCFSSSGGGGGRTKLAWQWTWKEELVFVNVALSLSLSSISVAGDSKSGAADTLLCQPRDLDPDHGVSVAQNERD
ncbi:unnamed protein product [Camellia sinensis]